MFNIVSRLAAATAAYHVARSEHYAYPSCGEPSWGEDQRAGFHRTMATMNEARQDLARVEEHAADAGIGVDCECEGWDTCGGCERKELLSWLRREPAPIVW